MSAHTDPVKDPRFMAAVDLLGRTGAHSFQIRYSDDEQPIVWLAVGEWKLDRRGRPARDGKHAGTYFDAAAGMDPLRAVLRLCDRMIDGGKCTHCHKPTAVSDNFAAPVPLEKHICWYIFDPELATFRRGCEGDTPTPEPEEQP